ncbi:MAG: SDR family NAD(P)-dependent oxidoreductase [Candidatus Marinimicrobia bacterium]|nr:SDR family NAD(P)-dependent oxidoreductase [Candidatus Neomarinimicrobiota bacterium]
MNQHIFITGASSGIGEHLAYHYARQGARLGLAARRGEVLRNVAEKCEQLGGQAHVYPLDVTNQAACKAAADDFITNNSSIDLLIANAGKSGDDHLETGDPTRINQILTINLLGVTNIVYPFAPHFIAQQAGTVVVISSIAGVRGLPRRGGYSSSKAAVKVLANSMRFTLSKHNVRVTTIYPGFIRTPMTARRQTVMPFLMDVELAATKIAKAIAAGKNNYLFPWQWRWLVPIIKIIPDAIVGKVV